MKKIFIDGSAGTTGLRIAERLEGRTDISIIKLTEENRKDPDARRDALNSADIAFLCLPDDAAREAVSLVESENTVIIDTSTAHRTSEGWTYGFPEIRGLREEIRTSKRIANPGCYASGFISLVAPLVEKGIIDKNACLSAFGISGYSGGGKKMIAAYEAEERDPLFEAPRIYALTQSHKHLPEMAKISGLSVFPVFSPIVSSYYSGMEICVPLFAKDIQGTPADIEKIYIDYYNSNLVRYVKEPDENGFLSAVSLSGKDSMQISVTGNSERILLVSRFDNLGKGASGAAIQNMNIAMGIEEETGLIL